MTTALEGGEWSAAPPSVLYPRERPDTRCIGGWVGPRAGLDGRNISPHREYYCYYYYHYYYYCYYYKPTKNGLLELFVSVTMHCATSWKVTGSIPEEKILPAALWPWGLLNL